MQLICHCEDCRASTGRSFAQIAFFKEREIAILGNVISDQYTSALGNQTYRDKCPKCGEVIFDRSNAFPGLIGVMAERIANFDFNPVAHVWAKSKIGLIDNCDALKVFEEGMT
ncbi:MAG: GFA family protein [Pseudomonadota bacterium]